MGHQITGGMIGWRGGYYDKYVPIILLQGPEHSLISYYIKQNKIKSYKQLLNKFYS